jgi:hypothetical protein
VCSRHHDRNQQVPHVLPLRTSPLPTPLSSYFGRSAPDQDLTSWPPWTCSNLSVSSTAYAGLNPFETVSFRTTRTNQHVQVLVNVPRSSVHVSAKIHLPGINQNAALFLIITNLLYLSWLSACPYTMRPRINSQPGRINTSFSNKSSLSQSHPMGLSPIGRQSDLAQHSR